MYELKRWKIRFWGTYLFASAILAVIVPAVKLGAVCADATTHSTQADLANEK